MKNSIIKMLTVLLVTIQIITFLPTTALAQETQQTTSGKLNYVISNPYETVDWSTFGQFKANFHSHTTESDGAHTPKEMIEDAYAKDFDIFVLSDHNFTSTTYDRQDRNLDWYLTPERGAEIASGVGRDGRGMINIPYSNEQSVKDHLNTFWADFNNESNATLESKIAMAQELGGISHISHPGRYTGARRMSFEEGAIVSSDPQVVGKYVDLFMKYPSCVGMEIINKKDGDSISDRILWDNILKKTMPERPVWGFSNDDTHSMENTGFSFNMMLMPENNLDEVRYSMENGTFYAVALISKRELGVDFVAEGPFPVISNIEVDQSENTITITGENYEVIEWIADGEIIATGNTIDLNHFEDKVNNYIRAQLKGPGGISFTQPFGLSVAKAEKAELKGSNIVSIDEEITVTYELKGSNNVYAQDVIVNYDADVFELVKVEASNDSTVIIDTTSQDGNVRIIAVNKDGVHGNLDVLDFTFKAKSIGENTYSTISIKGELGIAPEGYVVELLESTKTLFVSVSEPADINGDGTVNIGDLAIVSYHYMKNTQSPDWEEAKIADVNKDGVIDILDIAYVASKITQK